MGRLAPEGGILPINIYNPKRKKAFHRALKRGEDWALMQDNMNRMLKNISDAMFEMAKKQIFNINPLSKMLDKEFDVKIEATSDIIKPEKEDIIK